MATVVCGSCGEELGSSKIKEVQRGFGYYYQCGYCKEDLDNQDIAEEVYNS